MMPSSSSYDGLVDLLEVGERDGVADAGDHVLALGVLQVVAVDALRAGGRVAGERDAGAGVRRRRCRTPSSRCSPRCRGRRGSAPGGGRAPPARCSRSRRPRAPPWSSCSRGSCGNVPAGVVPDRAPCTSRPGPAGRPRRGRGRSSCRGRSLSRSSASANALGVDAEHGASRTSAAAGGRSRRRTARRRRSIAASPCTDSSLSPTLSTVSIIPGIENFAPGAHRDEQRAVGLAERAAHRLLERRAGAR